MFGAFLNKGEKYMGYIALYRKYRPGTFDSIIGQESVTKILKSQIKNNKISHAYIFSGTRGTGKTSAAKVFSRAINCLNPKDGEPCNECEVCKNILEGNTTDVIEMDAASNNSVENIRQIRQEVVYATVDVKYRVYIIDEAHMLTTSAFNALLKTLEEPPQNVVFILATTEQHKIPVTILSRCLRFDFNKISEENIIERIKMVLDEEKIQYEKDAIEYVAKLADGGMRDALSILERCISESKDILKYEDVVKIVGAIDNKVIEEIANDILNLNSVEAIVKIDEVIKKGKDLRQVNYQLIECFLEKLINTNENKDKYSRIIDRLSKLDNDLRLTSKPAIVFKAGIIELTTGAQITNSSDASNNNINDTSLLKKVSNLESEIVQLKLLINDIKNKSYNSITRDATQNIPKETVRKVTSESVNNQKVQIDKSKLKLFDDAENFKKTVVESGHIKLYSSLASSKIYTDEQNVIIVTNNSFAYSILVLDENIDILRNIYSTLYNSNTNIYIRLKEGNDEKTSKMENVLKENNINYTKLD